jgi:hypothetical protein
MLSSCFRAQEDQFRQSGFIILITPLCCLRKCNPQRKVGAVAHTPAILATWEEEIRKFALRPARAKSS